MQRRSSRARQMVVTLVACVVAGTATLAVQQTEPVLPAPREDLVAVPLPRLDELEPAVADQLREVAATLRERTARAGRGLAEAYGTAARVYHAYEFFESAEAGYRNALRLAPGDNRWAHLLGYLYQQTGRFEESADQFIGALRTRAGDYASALRLGEVYLQLNRYVEARAQFDGVAEVFPAAAANGLGEVALRDGRFEDAIRHFERALDRVPEATSIHYSLAMAYRGLGNLADAQAHLLRRGAGGIRAVDPVVDELQTLARGERALVMRGRRAYDAGQFAEAAEAFRSALAAEPSSVAARLNLGVTLSQLGDLAGATEHLQVAFDTEPGDGDAGRALVGALLGLGRDADAIAILTQITTANPDDEDATVGLGILLADRQRYEDAVAVLGEANRRFPGRATTATTLARLLASAPVLSLRDGRRALELAEAVHTSEPAPVHAETVALALAELGRCAEAADWIGRAVAAAEATRDIPEIARLRNEAPKYTGVSCRPPER